MRTSLRWFVTKDDVDKILGLHLISDSARFRNHFFFLCIHSEELSIVQDVQSLSMLQNRLWAQEEMYILSFSYSTQFIIFFFQLYHKVCL